MTVEELAHERRNQTSDPAVASSAWSGTCFDCEHWEPSSPDGNGPRRWVAPIGHCPVFSKPTTPEHGNGRVRCSAWFGLAAASPKPQRMNTEPNTQLPAIPPLPAPAGSATDAWRAYQDLYRKDVPVPEIEAAYEKWKELAATESQQPNARTQRPRAASGSLE